METKNTRCKLEKGMKLGCEGELSYGDLDDVPFLVYPESLNLSFKVFLHVLIVLDCRLSSRSLEDDNWLLGFDFGATD